MHGVHTPIARKCTPNTSSWRKPKEVLETMLPQMDVKKRWTLARGIANYHLKWAEAGFERYGSLYYRADLQDVDINGLAALGGQDSQLECFAIGPTTARFANNGGKISVKCDLGPCNYP
jgi:hypothetical protein